MTEDNPFVAAQEEHEKGRTKCQFCPEVEKLSVSRRQQLHDALFGKTLVGGKSIKHIAIVKVLGEWGVSVNPSVISKHVTGRSLSENCRNRVINKWGAAS